jgi:hypothetical protein
MNRTGMEAVRSIIYTRSKKITNMYEQAPRFVLELWGDFLIGVVYSILQKNPNGDFFQIATYPYCGELGLVYRPNLGG